MMTTEKYSSTFLKIFILCACVLFLYSFVLEAPFKILDDQISITANPDIQSLQQIPQVFQKSFFGDDHFYYRPLVTLTYIFEHYFFGLNYFFFNLGNVLLHLANVLLAFFFLSLLFKNKTFGFWGALLFAVHPIQAEAVGTIAGRSILLCAFFELSALLFFVLFFQDQKKNQKHLFLSLVSFALALLSKESSSVLPLIIFSYVFIFLREKRDRVPQATRLSLPFFIVFFVYLGVRLALEISRVSFVAGAKDYFCGILTFIRSLGTYARLLVFPADLYFDRIRPVIYNLLSPEALMTMGLAISGIILLIKFARRLKPEILFLIVFALIRFLPLSQILPIRSQAGYICIPDHFLYVPSVGLLALIVLFFSISEKILVEKKQAMKFFTGILAGGWIIFLSLATIEQNIYATNEIAMCQRTLSFVPNHVRTNTVLGLRYAADKDFKNAEKYFQKALDYEPMNTRARLGLGTALIDQGRYWEGLAEYEKISDTGTFKDMLEENKDLAYRKLITQYEAMFKKDPRNTQIYYSFGVVYAKKGDFEKAISYFKDALKFDPQHENARANLCNSYKALGREAQAKECFLELEKKEKRIK